jgi:glutamate-1-semialdehyde 2,1-aminomutase
MSFEQSRALTGRFHTVIPGGSHTYAKGDDQYPEGMAPIVVRGQGCHTWDVDGNEFIEYGMGLRAVALGHAFPSVVEAVGRQLALGANFVRPARIELEAAEALVSCIDGADMAKFAKNGSDVTTAAVRLARAVTGRDVVAIPFESSFLSVDDWYIGVTPMSAGVPAAVRALTTRFHYNDLDSVAELFAAHPGRIACLVLEPAGSMEPSDGFLPGLLELCERNGALLVFDEMITGFRWDLGGAQRVYGVTPHLSCFGKALGNGFSVSALAGRRDVMELGGLRHGDERVFLLSNTHGAETHSLAGALAVMHVYRSEPVIETLYRQGERLAGGVRQVAEARGVSAYFGVSGRACNLVFATRDAAGEPSQAYRTLFLQEMLRRGILAPSFVVSYSHADEDIDRTIEAVDEALCTYRRALDDGVDRYLDGRPVKPVMRPFN